MSFITMGMTWRVIQRSRNRPRPSLMRVKLDCAPRAWRTAFVAGVLEGICSPVTDSKALVTRSAQPWMRSSSRYEDCDASCMTICSMSFVSFTGIAPEVAMRWIIAGVMPESRRILKMSSIKSPLSLAFMPAVGSSSRSRRGSEASARAISSFLCSP